jgi:hypothetical protein
MNNNNNIQNLFSIYVGLDPYSVYGSY